MTAGNHPGETVQFSSVVHTVIPSSWPSAASDDFNAGTTLFARKRAAQLLVCTNDFQETPCSVRPGRSRGPAMLRQCALQGGVGELQLQRGGVIGGAVMRGVQRLGVLVLGFVLAACATTPSPVPLVPGPHPQTSSSSSPDGMAAEQAIEDYISSRAAPLDNLRAVVVLVDGGRRLEYYRHGFTSGDREHVWSVTKSVVATLVGIAIGDGLIPSLETPLEEVLPEYRHAMTTSTAKITLHQLMNHTSGVIGGDGTFSLQWDVLTGNGDPVLWALSNEHGRGGPPGHFLYSDLGAHLVAAVLHSALQRHPSTKGLSILDYARTKLFDPPGIVTRPTVQSSGFSATDPQFTGAGFGWAQVHGLELGGFGLRLTALDMAKLGQLYLDDGVLSGVRLLPEGWVSHATKSSPLSWYGLLWWLGVEGRYEAHGFEGQRIVVIPGRKAVIVTLCATADTDYPMDEIDDLITTAILPSLG